MRALRRVWSEGPVSNKPSSKPTRGMRDLLPPEVALRDHVQGVIQGVYRRYGFTRIETPAVESLALMSGSQGGENEKLIYRILERGEKLTAALGRIGEGGSADALSELSELGLRFDLTVPLARFYAEHHAELPLPFKSIQIGPVWRAERPQKGRYRQFVQCDIDVLGDGGVLVEAELVLATCEVLARLGLSGFSVRYNDRRVLSGLAALSGVPVERHGAVFIALDKLDKLPREAVCDELLAAGLHDDAARRLLDLVQPAAGEGAGATSPLDALQAALAGHGDALDGVTALRALAAALDALLPRGAAARFDPSLVRGMGYYTGPIFEIGLQSQAFSLAGGGRYDRMVGALLGRDVPACGFSIGFERLLLVLQEQGLAPAPAAGRVALLHDAEHDVAAVLRAAESLRGEHAVVSVLPRRKKLARQLDELLAHGFDGFSVFDGRDASPVRALTAAVSG